MKMGARGTNWRVYVRWQGREDLELDMGEYTVFSRSIQDVMSDELRGSMIHSAIAVCTTTQERVEIPVVRVTLPWLQNIVKV